MQRWFPDIPVWVWCLLFGVTIFTINALSARSYAETEFWFSSIKVSAIIAFIILGGAAMFGFIDLKATNQAPAIIKFRKSWWFIPKWTCRYSINNGYSQLFLPRYRTCRNRSR